MWSNPPVRIELRIHGVSGTPPADMLGGPVVADDRFNHEPPLVHRPVGGDGSLVSFRWASRTSGTAASAMWLLLIPYMLVNLAGWALGPAPDRRHRASVAAVRISGLLLTLVFAMVTATGVIGVGAFQVVRARSSWSTALLAGVVVSSLIAALLWFSTTRAEEARNDRPYLRAPHMAMALWGIWATAVTAAAESAGIPEPIGSMWLLPVALCVLTAATSVWHGLEDMTRIIGRVAVAAAVLLLLSVVVRPLDQLSDLPTELATVGGPLRGAVIAYAVVAIVTTALAWSREHPDAGPTVGALLALAGSTGAAVGAGAVVVSGAAFGIEPPGGTSALAQAFLAGAASFVVVAAVHVWSHMEPGRTPLERLARTVVSVRDDIRPILLGVCAVTVTFGTLGLAQFDSVLPWIAAGAGPLAVAAMSAVLYRLGYRRTSVAIAAVGVTAVLGVWLDWWSFPALAVVFTLVVPVAVVTTRVVGAWSDETRRRSLAIPWDIGSFFSRRFHPFAPPTYRDVVEHDLMLVLAQLTRTGDTVVVSGHSQGSIVAATTLAQMGDDTPILTHGSPLSSLYMRFFPRSFPGDTVARVGERPWTNLWRTTDPVAGAIRGVDDRRLNDPKVRIHGRYWLENEYAEALEAMLESGGDGRR